MKKIALVCGYYGFFNPGDDAILDEILKLLKRHGIEPVVLYNTNNHFLKNGVHYIPRNNLIYLFRWMREASFLISGGGGLFQDSTSFRSFLYYFFIIAIAYFLQIKVFIYGQSFGPIKKKLSLVLLQRALYMADGIFVRDSSSLKLSYLLGTDKKIYFLPDIVYLNDVTLSKTLNRGIFRILLFPREKKNIEKLIQILKEILNIFNLEFIIIPMHYDLDRDVGYKIYTRLRDGKKVKFIDRRLSKDEILQKIKDVDCVISYRFHGLLFSHLLNKPFIGISDDPKIVSFLSDLNKEVILLNDNFERLKKWIFKIYTTRKKDLLFRDMALLRKKLANKISKNFIRSTI